MAAIGSCDQHFLKPDFHHGLVGVKQGFDFAEMVREWIFLPVSARINRQVRCDFLWKRQGGWGGTFFGGRTDRAVWAKECLFLLRWSEGRSGSIVRCVRVILCRRICSLAAEVLAGFALNDAEGGKRVAGRLKGSDPWRLRRCCLPRSQIEGTQFFDGSEVGHATVNECNGLFA